MSLPVLAHIGLNCIDQAVTERFYTRHFGFKRARVIPRDDDSIIFLRSGDCYLELFQARETSPEPSPENSGPEYAGFRHLAFNVDDLDASLEGFGPDIDITLGPLDLDHLAAGWRVVWIRDPDGRIIELSQGYRDEGAVGC